MAGLTEPESLLNTATEIEHLVRALILIRDNENTRPNDLPVVVHKLAWIAQQVDETTRILRGRELR